MNMPMMMIVMIMTMMRIKFKLVYNHDDEKRCFDDQMKRIGAMRFQLIFSIGKERQIRRRGKGEGGISRAQLFLGN